VKDRVLLTDQETFELVGKLCGGLAHRYNNLLNVISGYASMMVEDEKDEQKNQDLQRILEAASQIKHVNSVLKAMGPGGSREPESFSIQKLHHHLLETYTDSISVAPEIPKALMKTDLVLLLESIDEIVNNALEHGNSEKPVCGFEPSAIRPYFYCENKLKSTDIILEKPPYLETTKVNSLLKCTGLGLVKIFCYAALNRIDIRWLPTSGKLRLELELPVIVNTPTG
jgi:hypothetical protein